MINMQLKSGYETDYHIWERKEKGSPLSDFDFSAAVDIHVLEPNTTFFIHRPY